MNLTDTLEKCPNCQRLFYKLLPSRAELLAKIADKESRYVYCNEDCLKVKLSNINSRNSSPLDPSLVIKNERRIEKNGLDPVIYVIDFFVSYPKIEVKHVS